MKVVKFLKYKVGGSKALRDVGLALVALGICIGGFILSITVVEGALLFLTSLLLGLFSLFWVINDACEHSSSYPNTISNKVFKLIQEYRDWEA